MKRQAYQHPELRDANDSIIQDGAFGKKTPLANAEGTGWIDYVANDLEALHDAINGGRVYVANKAALTKPGDVANVYIARDTGKWYYWDPGTSAYVEIDNARNVANDAIAARDLAKAWAQSTSSPDGAADTASPTGKTQSSKTWALYSAALVDKTEKNSIIVGEQLKQAQALATANAGIQIYLDDDGDLAYRRIE